MAICNSFNMSHMRDGQDNDIEMSQFKTILKVLSFSPPILTFPTPSTVSIFLITLFFAISFS